MAATIKIKKKTGMAFVVKLLGVVLASAVLVLNYSQSATSESPPPEFWLDFAVNNVVIIILDIVFLLLVIRHFTIKVIIDGSSIILEGDRIDAEKIQSFDENILFTKSGKKYTIDIESYGPEGRMRLRRFPESLYTQII